MFFDDNCREGRRKGGRGDGARKRREKKKQAARLVFGRGSAHFTSHGAPERRHCPSPPEVTSAGRRRSTLNRAERGEEINKVQPVEERKNFIVRQ